MPKTTRKKTQQKTFNGADILVEALIRQGAEQIFAYPGGAGWVPGFGGLARDIGVGADGTEWIVGLTGRVHRFGNAGLEDMHIDLPGEAKRIAVNANGNAWVVMDDGAIFSWAPAQ